MGRNEEAAEMVGHSGGATVRGGVAARGGVSEGGASPTDALLKNTNFITIYSTFNNTISIILIYNTIYMVSIVEGGAECAGAAVKRGETLWPYVTAATPYCAYSNNQSKF